MTQRFIAQNSISALSIALLALIAQPLAAQIDLSGVWTPRYHEDQKDRVPGPDLGDFTGIPLNQAGLLSAMSWDASRLTLPEQQCRVHAAPYIYHGPLAFRSWEEKDPRTQQLLAIKQYTGTYEQERTIWMDGRAHPPAWAPHTWMGFSTGKWTGNILTVATTHIKQDWIRRNGVAESDRTTMTEQFIRHGSWLTHVTLIDDPVNLAEPMMRTENFGLDLNYQGTWLYPCEPAVEVANRTRNDVPMHQPGENPFMKEYPRAVGIPEASARGGRETTYPEYRSKVASNTAIVDAAPKTSQRPGRVADAEVHAMKVQGNITMLATAMGNAAVQMGEQGTLVVDTLPAAMSAMLLDAISRLTDRKVQFIINTSSSEAATGGNEAVRRAGITVVDLTAPGSFMPTDAAATAQLIAHENVLNRLVEARKPSSAWPTSTFLDGLEKSLYFNGEPIRMIPQPATTDGSAIVFFRRSDVIATGDLFLTDAYPRIDLARGGSVQGVIDGLNKVIDLAVPAHMEEGGTMIIPGRGRLCDRSDVVVYRDMVTIVRNRIAALKKRGQTLAQVQAARPTEDYDPLYGAESGDWTTAQFVEGVYSSIR